MLHREAGALASPVCTFAPHAFVSARGWVGGGRPVSLFGVAVSLRLWPTPLARRSCACSM